MSLLEVHQLTLRFGGLTAVNQVSFNVEPGEIFSLIGPNGAGKTTVFNAITGVYEPTEGCILFEGRRMRRPLTWKTILGIGLIALFSGTGLLVAVNSEALWNAAINTKYVWHQPFSYVAALGGFGQCLRGLPAQFTWFLFTVGAAIGATGAGAVWHRARRTPDVVAANGIARTFQNIRIFPEMTAIENVLVGMDSKFKSRVWDAAFRLPRFWREHKRGIRKAVEILRFVEMDRHANTVAENLAYGHQRRLEIARALATEPRLLLLDEPAAGMNPSETLALMDLIRKIRDKGIAILLIEHDMKVVMKISDRIAVLDYGNKIAEGNPREIRQNPKVMAAYLGTAEAS